MCFDVESDSSSQELMEMIETDGPEAALEKVSGLDKRGHVFKEIIISYNCQTVKIGRGQHSPQPLSRCFDHAGTATTANCRCAIDFNLSH